MTPPPSSAAQLQAVREWVVKAVPELRSFGGRLYCNQHHDTDHCSIPLVVSKDGKTARCPKPHCKEKGYAYLHDIGICEVLRAMRYISEEQLPMPYALSQSGRFICIDIAGEWHPMHCSWKLDDDNLDRQSPKTISFLFSLIPHD